MLPLLKRLPGSAIEVDISRPGAADAVFSSMFLAGGLMLSQVSQFTGLEPHLIQNWVKRGYLSPPMNKKYTRRQLCRILLINLLRDNMPLDTVCKLLSYINGQLDEEEDDLIDDSVLYLYVLELTIQLEMGHMDGAHGLNALCEKELENYIEPYTGAKKRISLVLQVVMNAYVSSHFKQEAVLLMKQVEDENEQ